MQQRPSLFKALKVDLPSHPKWRLSTYLESSKVKITTRFQNHFMKKLISRLASVATVACGMAIVAVHAQQASPLTQEQRDERWKTENELESLAVVEHKVMMPMRDGIRLATDIYRPKNASGKVPVIWVRTPYNFNFWDVRNGVPADMKAALTAVKRGYAYVVQNERGHFFSEGNYDILGAPRTDGYDALTWLSS